MHIYILKDKLSLLLKLTLIIVLPNITNAYALNSDYKLFKNIIPDSEANVITSFIQDSDGLLWLGTNKGLFSYDGYSHYPHFDIGDKYSTRIYCMALFGDRYILSGTDNTLLIYNRKTASYESPEVVFNGLASEKIPVDIKSLYLCNEMLWVGTLNGLFRINTLSGEILSFKKNEYEGLTHNTVYSIVKCDNDDIYLGTYDGLCRINQNTNTFNKINIPTENNKSNLFVNTLLYDSNDESLWIGTEGELFRYYLNTDIIEKIRNFPENSVKTLSADDNSNLLVGTDNGLYIIDRYNNVSHIVHDSRDINSLSNNIVWNIFKDSDRNIWIGTDYGVSISMSDKPVDYIPIYEITGVGDGNHFYTLFCDSRQRKWFGGTNGLICVKGNITAGSGIWYRMSEHNNSISHNRIRDIYEDSDRNLWVATDGSICLFDEKTQKFVRYDITDKTGAYNSNWAYNIMEDNKSRLWVATCLGGIFVVEKEKLLKSSGRCIADYNFNTDNGLSGMFINQIVTDKNNDIWVLLYNNGINKINGNTFEVSCENPENIAVNSPNYILADKDGNIWIACKGGIVKVDVEKDETIYLIYDESKQSEVLSMTEINNEIWLSSTTGMFIIDRDSYKISQACNTMRSYSSVYYSEGSIYMGYSDGIAISVPEVFRNTPQTHDLRLSAININNKKLLSYGGMALSFVDDISFSHNESDLIFEFSDLPYTSEVKNKFLYTLVGRDNVWNSIPRDDNRITFNSLPYGDYILKIKKDLPGNNEELSQRFSITPPFYLSLWAKNIYSIIIIFLISGIIKYLRVKAVLRREKRDKAIIIEQTRQKIAFYDNVSHSFTEPLSKIITPVSRMLTEIKDGNQLNELSSVQSNALKINGMLHNMLEFDRLEKSHNNTLILSSVDIVSLIHRVLENHKESLLLKKEINVNFTSLTSIIMINIDMLKIETVISNVISNASKFTNKGGNISVSVYNKESGIIIKIEDDGIGIPKKDLPYVTQRFFQSSNNKEKKDGTGIGLYLAKCFTEMHNGTFSINSQDNHGTEVSINLPFIDNNSRQAGIGDADSILIHNLGLMGSMNNIIKEEKEEINYSSRLIEESLVEPSADQIFLNNVTAAVEDRIDDFDLNVTSLCDQLSVNNKQMYRKVKQLTGMSPVEYIKVIRMKKAAVLLKQNKFTVSEIVYMVGFSNASYFAKCFQSEFGIPPKQYMDTFKPSQTAVLS